MSEFASSPSAPASLSIGQRRVIYTALVIITMAVLIWMTVKTLSPGGFGFSDLLFTFFFAVTLPWTVIGFWNAVIGFLIEKVTDRFDR